MDNRNICYTLSVLLVCIIHFTPTHSQTSPAINFLMQNPCISKTTCSSCIQSQGCGWCMDADFDTKPRCFSPQVFKDPTVHCKDIYYPKNFFMALIHENLTSTTRREQSGGYEAGVSIEGESSASGSYGGQGSASGGFGGGAAGAGSGSAGAKIVQIYPQRVQLKLRTSEDLFYINFLQSCSVF